jgi:hypothetical protein
LNWLFIIDEHQKNYVYTSKEKKLSMDHSLQLFFISFTFGFAFRDGKRVKAAASCRKKAFIYKQILAKVLIYCFLYMENKENHKKVPKQRLHQRTGKMEVRLTAALMKVGKA